MKPVPISLSEVEFDERSGLLETLIDDWVERECMSFDEAVSQTPQTDDGDGSIWDMPSIDSKRVVSLLVELERVIGGQLPPTLIKRGGYRNVSDVKGHLLPKIRQLCTGAGVASVATENASSTAQVTP